MSSKAQPTFFVVFGAAVWPGGRPSGAMRRRTLGAWQQSQSVVQPRFLLTGGQGRHGPPEAVVMRQLLIEAGAPESAIQIEDQAGDTLDSVVYCQRLLAPAMKAGARVVAVSSDYHVPRCRILFRLMGVPAESGCVGGSRAALGLGRWLVAVLREAVAMVWDVLLVVFWHRHRRG